MAARYKGAPARRTPDRPLRAIVAPASEVHEPEGAVASMQRIETKIQPSDPDFRENARHMRSLVDKLRAALDAVRRGGDDTARRRHTERGKLLVRDRIDALVDPGTPFFELSPLAAHGAGASRP